MSGEWEDRRQKAEEPNSRTAQQPNSPTAYHGMGVMSEKPSTCNVQLVSVSAKGIMVQLPKQTMTRQEALVHAAWLVALAEENEGDFDRTLAAVRES